jgi:ankyrin repeat protein
LLKCGANPNTADKHRNTPLHWACQNGHTNVVKFLLSTKINVNALNMYNYSPLDSANDRKNMDILQMLKKAGAKSGAKMATPTGLPKKRDFIIK